MKAWENQPGSFAIFVRCHRNAEEQHAKMFLARAPETTRETEQHKSLTAA
jgi:hypothetical protein